MPEKTPFQETSPSAPASSSRVTMRTLAEQLGVTKTTVSLALRGHSSISKATRDRVHKLAQELNYRPDPAIAAIAAHRWSRESPQRHRVIAFLSYRDPRLANPGLAYLPAARERAKEYGYKLERFYLDDYPSAEAVTRVLYSRGIRGIVVPPLHNPNSKRAMHLEWSKFTAVCCGIGRVRPSLHTVTSDVFATTRHVWETVAQAGHTRIGAALYCHQPKAEDDWHRIGATTAAIRFLDLRESAAIPIHTAEIRDEPALIAWYEQYRPEVVIGFNHSIGEALERHGLRLPQDLQFICLNTPPREKWSGITHHHDEMGRTSIDLLNNEMRSNHWGLPATPNITLIQTEWNRGETFQFAPDWQPSPATAKPEPAPAT